MAQVACFCGCCFSFDGAAGSCPWCGEVASLITSVSEIAVRDWLEEPVPAMRGTSEAEQLPRPWAVLGGDGVLAGLAANSAQPA